MKKIILLIFIATFFFVAFKDLPGTMSTGAPAASTGAPGEKHCATSGCHATFPINSGSAELSFSINNRTQYETGKTYPITVSITDPGMIRFGFQVVALKNSDNTNAGIIKLMESQRTQVISGYGTTADRKYITYTFDGTSAVSPGIGKWTFDWTAPETNEGALTFYLAAIAADNDGTDDGDYCYTKKIMLDAPAASWNVFPTIGSGAFMVKCSGFSPDKIAVYNLSGEKIYERPGGPNPGTFSLELTQPNGVYFLVIVRDDKSEHQKIVINR